MPRRRYRHLPLSERIKDGRVYYKSGTSRTGIIYLRCRRTTLCHGTAKIINHAIVEMTAHSPYCLLDESAELIAQFKDALKDSLRRHWYRLRDLYEQTALVHPEAATEVPFRTIRSFMKRCRKNSYPPHPQNIAEFVDRLMDPQYRRNLEYVVGRRENTEHGRLSINLITDDRGNNHALIRDEVFVREKMQDVDRLFVDGTFRSTPNINDAAQLVTIMGIKMNHGFPFIWVIMSSKTQAAYTAVLRHVKQHVIPQNRIRLVMTDFERGLRNAIIQTFPEAHSTGCNTHHDRALYRKTEALGLHNLLRADEDARLFLKKIMALAFLPANSIQGQYVRLKNNLAPNLARRLRPFCQYYDRYWLRTVTPQGYSVYGLGRRTNNVIESYHSRLRHKLEARPAPWDFVCKLLKLQTHAKADVKHLENNRQIGRHARYSTIFKQKQLVRAWRELHMREISIDEFVTKAASLKGNVTEMITRERMEMEEAIGGDSELQERPAAIPLDNDPDYDADIFADDPPVWLHDNAPLPLENDEPNGPPVVYSDDSDTSDDEEEVPNVNEEVIPDPRHGVEVEDDNRQEAQLPVAIDDEIRARPQIGRENNNGRQPPPPLPIDDEIPRLRYGELINVIEGRPAPPEPHIVIDDEMPLPLPQNRELAYVEEPPSPPAPPIVIDDEMPLPLPQNRELAYVEKPPSPPAPPIVIDDEMPLPLPQNRELPYVEEPPSPPAPPIVIGRRRRNRQKKRQAVREPVAPTEATSTTNRNRNRRRLEMRKISIARQRELEQLRNDAAQAAILRAETARLQAQLAEAQQQIESTNENAKCLICRDNVATHAYVDCGHRLACGQCCARLWDTQEIRCCPLCRKPATQPPQRIWLPGE